MGDRSAPDITRLLFMASNESPTLYGGIYEANLKSRTYFVLFEPAAQDLSMSGSSLLQ